jgi:signal transduction histidine kinase
LANVMCWLALPCAIGSVGADIRDSRPIPVRLREEEIRHGADAERRNIAHEIYETVGQGLAAINIYAAAALRLAAKQPERVLEILQTIVNESRTALHDLRAVLGTPVRPENGGVRGWQLPGLHELPALVSTLSGSGLAVNVVELGTPADLSVAVDLAAFRIVQRSLANVLRHASSTTVTVRIEHGTKHLTLQITDNRDEEAGSLPQETTGIGEQVEAMGGEMEAGPAAGGGFQIRVRLPVH